ncbi:pimeloyl-ACP methyl ester carboxylesterase [Silvibacterium bohemicum]|uniref:Pimeloyl-ACP methyl ester carboxylesterase n=1 Tax=Silvibacterium bohemicum TaxID=1577686 RepID=A0A841JST5_9BACT|nr:hypothetical protein [Silvibacterium bohemicum]MBB6144463.1 pimeloyl-ACP methyl ester carboxylesterase [Silvibacterium bohemicum]
MWQVTAVFEDRRPEYIDFTQFEDQHQLFSDLVPIARERWGATKGIPWHVLEATAENGPAPWSDPIPLWATEGSLETDSIRIERGPEGAVALSLRESGHLVWQHPTVVLTVIPEGAVELILQYRWNLPGFQPTFVDYGVDAVGELLPVLDGRLYGGAESVILEVNEPPAHTWMNRAGSIAREWAHSWKIGVRNLSGLFVGKIARRAVDRPRPLLRDPGYIPRLRAEEARDSLGASCKELSNFKTSDVNPAVPLVVAVHGSFSCSVELASRLKVASPIATIVRFEHDTFRRISENVNALASELQRLHSKGLRRALLVSHSRGGLVASQAALRLKLVCPDLEVTVWSAGTPHQGTPIAGFGAGAAFIAGAAQVGMNAYYRTCARKDGNALGVTTAEGAASYLYSFDALPPGISAMAPDSPFIDMHSFQIEPISPRTWGGICDPVSSGSFGQGLLATAAQNFFENQPNDLIVAAESSILDGSSPLQQCNHFQYFSEIALPDALAKYLADQ